MLTLHAVTDVGISRDLIFVICASGAVSMIVETSALQLNDVRSDANDVHVVEFD